MGVRGHPRQSRGCPLTPWNHYNEIVQFDHGGPLTETPPLTPQDREKTIAACREAVRRSPQDVDAHTRLGLALFEAGSYSQAADAYGAAILLEPDRAAHYADYGVASACAGRIQEALDACRQAVYLFPADPIAQQFLGFALRLAGQDAEAVEVYRRAISLHWEDSDSRVGLASALRRLGRLPEAAEILAEAVQLNPHGAGPRIALGMVYRDLGRDADASRELAEARRLARGGPSYHLACLAAADGDLEAALALLSVALAHLEAPRAEARIDPDLEPLHADPRFWELVKGEVS